MGKPRCDHFSGCGKDAEYVYLNKYSGSRSNRCSEHRLQSEFFDEYTMEEWEQMTKPRK